MVVKNKISIKQELKNLDTTNMTIPEIATYLDSTKATINKYLHLFGQNFKRMSHDRHKYICKHCGQTRYGGRATKYCRSKDCQIAKEKAWREPGENKRKCPQCGEWRNKNNFVTDLCKSCVAFNDFNYGDGWVRFTG